MQLNRRIRQVLQWSLALSMVLIAIGRVLFCHTIYAPTFDEPITVAAGMELIDRGTYSLETLHPPLARVLSAALPYAYGIRSVGRSDLRTEGRELFRSQPSFQKIISLARIGNLVPFAVASFAVGIWAYYCGGSLGALISVFLFTTLPTILGHAAVATLDMSCAAFTCAAFLSLWLWLENRTYSKSVLAGAAIGLALLSKFSAFGFLSFAMLFFVIATAVVARTAQSRVESSIGYLRPSCVVLMVCGYVIWIGYACSFHSIGAVNHRSMDFLNNILGHEGVLHDLSLAFIKTVPIPAPEFFDGLLQLQRRDQEGHLCYVLGDVRTHGSWYLYPLRLLVKTPIAFIILTLIGSIPCQERGWSHSQHFRILAPLLGSLAILSVGMLSSVNNGVRQILAIYPLLAVIAGMGCLRLWKLGGRSHWGAIATVGLLGWETVSSANAAPRLSPLFNELVRGQPERFVADSDLDWGQDQGRMVAALKKLGAENVGVAILSGYIDLDQFDPPSWHLLKPNQRVDGWVAISFNRLKLGRREPPYDQYSWLEEHEPIERVGKSILIFRIPKSVE